MTLLIGTEQTRKEKAEEIGKGRRGRERHKKKLTEKKGDEGKKKRKGMAEREGKGRRGKE
jgi:hypothetical protein